MNEPTTPQPTPSYDMLPRPEGMSRQVHRRLYRFACKQVGVKPKFARPNGKKLDRAARKLGERLRNDKLPRGAVRNGRRNTSAKWSNLFKSC